MSFSCSRLIPLSLHYDTRTFWIITNQKSTDRNKGPLPLPGVCESQTIQVNRACGLVILSVLPGVCCWSDSALRTVGHARCLLRSSKVPYSSGYCTLKVLGQPCANFLFCPVSLAPQSLLFPHPDTPNGQNAVVWLLMFYSYSDRKQGASHFPLILFLEFFLWNLTHNIDTCTTLVMSTLIKSTTFTENVGY